MRDAGQVICRDGFDSLIFGVTDDERGYWFLSIMFRCLFSGLGLVTKNGVVVVVDGRRAASRCGTCILSCETFLLETGFAAALVAVPQDEEEYLVVLV